ncbi:hypothetical protein L195_g004667 [Trifolium pratense]|uniref:Uncharacterized protein n=1 Tax=Trifolium pratense TaxID=57577 RepID=A0A2K3NYN8_TRIPR|nr:hypothetical protein L195_g004667 [Trifolium pratense]
MDDTRIDKEYDVGDWCFLSDYESDDSNWLIERLKPLRSDFESNDNDDEDDSGDDSFAVLVPCYLYLVARRLKTQIMCFLQAQNRWSKRNKGQFD